MKKKKNTFVIHVAWYISSNLYEKKKKNFFFSLFTVTSVIVSISVASMALFRSIQYSVHCVTLAIAK